jgi:hypothetical protein
MMFAGCGESKLDATTEITSAAEESRRAVMEPLQGGPMLYRYRGKEPYRTEIIHYSEYDDETYERALYPFGLINQNGKIVAEPQYADDNRFAYVYDSGGRVVGMLMEKETDNAEDAYTYYSLDGKARPAHMREFIQLSYVPGYAFAGTDECLKHDVPEHLRAQYCEGTDLLLETVEPIGGTEYANAYLIVDKAGAVQKAFDFAGEPMWPSKEFRVLYGANYLFSFRDGEWNSLDLRTIDGELLGAWDYQRNTQVHAACEDYIVVKAGKYVDYGDDDGWVDRRQNLCHRLAGQALPQLPAGALFRPD